MLKILLVSLLLTLVYSWEEFKRVLRVLFFGLVLKKDPGRYYKAHLDQFVGILIMLATIPIGLAYFLASNGSAFNKLGILALGLFAVSLVAAGSSIMLRRGKLISEYGGIAKLVPITFSLAGLVSPLFRSFGNFEALPRRMLAKFAFFLSLPPLAGLVFKYLNSASPEVLVPNLDLLTLVLVAALFARIIIDFLERYFHLYRLENLSSYFRVVLGIILATVLLAGLIS